MDKLRPKHRRAAEMLAQGSSITDVTLSLKLRPGTLLRWRQQAVFIAEVDHALAELAQAASSRRIRLADKTIEKLYKELDGYGCDPKVVSAALNVLKAVLNAPELTRNGPNQPETPLR